MRKGIGTLILLLVGTTLAFGQWIKIDTKDPRFVVNQAAYAAATNSDTITGFSVNAEGMRRVVFQIRTNNSATCSTATIHVSMNDTAFVNADGLPGLSVNSDADGAVLGTGGKSVELAATGSSRIRWKYARAVVLPKCCALGQMDSVRIVGKTQSD